jgi:uncharacterized membrane-anchored protein YhcB (DUF1043 family)
LQYNRSPLVSEAGRVREVKIQVRDCLAAAVTLIIGLVIGGAVMQALESKSEKNAQEEWKALLVHFNSYLNTTQVYIF